jgi:hypothetical protein
MSISSRTGLQLKMLIYHELVYRKNVNFITNWFTVKNVNLSWTGLHLKKLTFFNSKPVRDEIDIFLTVNQFVMKLAFVNSKPIRDEIDIS